MKIAIDGRMIQESGIGRYIRNLLFNLKDLDQKNEYFILLLQKDFNTQVLSGNFHKVLADFRWYGVSEQFKIPKLLHDLEPDLVHFPHFNAPFLYNGKFVVTIHDLIHQHFQMRRATTLNPIFYKIKQLGYKKIFKQAVDKSKKILVPSNYVRDLLVNEWKIKLNKIIVTYEAVDNKIFSIEKKMTENNMEKIRSRFNIKLPYIFYVGNAHPHKNVEGLIKSFLILKRNFPNLQLVLAGFDHYFWRKVKKEFQQKDIIFTGSVSDEELVALYKGAKCFVMPSKEEGFGIPTLEAMVCKCPVVSSNKGSLFEVGGDAAIYFDPLNLSDMSNKIAEVLSNQVLKRKLIENGEKRVEEFSWTKLAKQTLEVYQSCV